ncbi:hypothetical protein D1872_266560 [compost metagenome]
MGNHEPGGHYFSGDRQRRRDAGEDADRRRRLPAVGGEAFAHLPELRHRLDGRRPGRDTGFVQSGGGRASAQASYGRKHHYDGRGERPD